MVGKKIKIKFKSFDLKAMYSAVSIVREAATKSGAVVSGPIPMPKHRFRFTTLRSPHVDKKSMDAFALITYKRLMEISNFNNSTVEELSRIEVHPAVGIQIKVV